MKTFLKSTSAFCIYFVIILYSSVLTYNWFNPRILNQDECLIKYNKMNQEKTVYYPGDTIIKINLFCEYIILPYSKITKK